jgi:hypothetical protein
MFQGHSSITSHMYEVIKVVEFDVDLDFDSFSLRIELLRSATTPDWFRVHVWRTELYRLQATFPQDKPSGQPLHEPSDENILVDWSHYLAHDYKQFQASNSEAALELVFDDIRRFLVRVTGKEV